MNLTLPTDSDERKETPLTSGCLAYFPAALAGVARVSKAGNDKHNKGEPLHHARGKSMDHADCIVRHLMDVQDLIAVYDRHVQLAPLNEALLPSILAEASQLCWRALALSQELHERFGAPLAPGARLPEPVPSPYAGKITENVCASVAPTPGFPITPGYYKSRDGRTLLVARILQSGSLYPVRGPNDGDCWTLGGRYWVNGGDSPLDLVERVSDSAPHRSDPVDYP